jgi:hypothetical protein
LAACQSCGCCATCNAPRALGGGASRLCKACVLLAPGGSKSIWDINWAYVGTMANILVSGTLHKLMPRVWEAPAMLVGLFSAYEAAVLW